MTNTGIETGFIQGNAESLYTNIYSQLPQALTTLWKTIDPIIYSSLIKLLGSNTRFDKLSADITLEANEDKIVSAMHCILIYNVPDFSGYEGPMENVQSDIEYIQTDLLNVPNIDWANTISIDTNSGNVTFTFVLPII